MIDKKIFEFVTASPQETVELGKTIGSALRGAEIITLAGELGSGKTHLVKGISTGLGVSDSDQVNSPTFVIVNEYISADGRFDIYHIDAYRIDSINEFEMLGFDDFCYSNSIVLIEWADKVQKALHGVDSITLELSHLTENKRKIKIANLPLYLAEALAS